MTNKTRGTLLEKQGKTHKRLSSMNIYTWSWPTSKNVRTTGLYGHRISFGRPTGSDGWEGWVRREIPRNPCYQRDYHIEYFLCNLFICSIFIYIYIYIYVYIYIYIYIYKYIYTYIYIYIYIAEGLGWVNRVMISLTFSLFIFIVYHFEQLF